MKHSTYKQFLFLQKITMRVVCIVNLLYFVTQSVRLVVYFTTLSAAHIL
jgi:hypothetical protein